MESENRDNGGERQKPKIATVNVGASKSVNDATVRARKESPKKNGKISENLSRKLDSSEDLDSLVDSILQTP